LNPPQRKSPRKGSENHQKGATGETHQNHEEPRRIIYTYHEGSYKVYLASQSSFPLTISHHQALKLVLESKGKRKRKIAKQNELGFQEMVSILSPLGLYGGNRKTKLPLKPNTRIHAPEGTFGKLWRRSIGRMPSDRKLA
jgi:hypothetical protein